MEISRKASPTRGAVELFEYLRSKNIPTYIISTSYTQHAHNIAIKLGHPIENVRCTRLDFSLKPESTEALEPLFEDIFPRYLEEGLTAVKRSLDRFFFQEIPKSAFGPIFKSTIVCGSGRKREEVVAILHAHSLSASEVFAVGDSITDIQMLEYVRANEGMAVSFNGNDYSLKSSSIAFSGESIYPLKQIIEAFPKTKEFVQKFPRGKDQQQEEFFLNLVEGIPKKDYDRILALQKKYRKLLREKAAQLT
ncbi:MAG: hypothetical protein HZR80_18210 [Candidatus Heimdallarchaeota archaeon]